MFGNTFGHLFRLTSFGESHGLGIGGIIDGCPSNLPLDESVLQRELDLRRPGSAPTSTTRAESDTVRLLSGVFEGKTTGTPIAFLVQNTNARSQDYDEIAKIFRPGHADLSYTKKFGIRDPRGGGRSSGRETIARVAGGAIAQVLLRQIGVEVLAYTLELGGIAAQRSDIDGSAKAPYFSPDSSVTPLWDAAATAAKADGDTLGGVVEIVARNVPAGLGEPVFGKLDAMLAAALMSVGAVKGVEIGSGFAAARMRGSENNDPITPTGFVSNNAGGILGGISSGQELVLRAAVKPIASISKEQNTINRDGEACKIRVSGRHDISAIPRIVPVLKAMTALVLADAVLLQRRQG